MDQSAATGEAPVKERSKEQQLSLVRAGDLIAPKAPEDIASARLEEGALADLAAKLGFTVARFTIEGLGKQLHVAPPLAEELVMHLCHAGLVEETRLTRHYAITQRGRQHAARAMEVCAYIGPAPVRLEAYAAMLRWQFSNTPQVAPEHVAKALSGLVLTPKAMH